MGLWCEGRVIRGKTRQRGKMRQYDKDGFRSSDMGEMFFLVFMKVIDTLKKRNNPSLDSPRHLTFIFIEDSKTSVTIKS